MSDEFDLLALADEIAEIARTTRDSATGARLMDLHSRLLTWAGLPPGHAGGGGFPAPWLSEPALETA